MRFSFISKEFEFWYNYASRSEIGGKLNKGNPPIQAEIIQSPHELQQLVISGPGTGKTFCLIERLNYLATHVNLHSTDILVLSFSVAAVLEIKKRLKGAIEKEEFNEWVLYANIRTFDSFASHFLLKFDPEIELTGKNYDERIQMAVNLIKNDEEAQGMLKRYKHVLVDEIQDLIGCRAQLTQQVLKYCGGGFTLFGDPAQAIYDYLIEEESNGPSSEEFLTWVSKQFNRVKIFKHMKENYRTGGDNYLDETAKKGRSAIFNEEPVNAYKKLDSIFCNLEHLGSLNNPSLNDSFFDSDTVVLCRTNGQLLCLAKYLYKSGYPFDIRRRNEDRLIPSWIGRVFFGWQDYKISKGQFEAEFLKRCENRIMQNWEEAWEQLKNVEAGKDTKLLNIEKLRPLLRYESILASQETDNSCCSAIELSTIHRAKGREFEKVIVIMSDNPVIKEEAAQESKVLYVALTRARKELYRMSEKGSKGCIKIGEEERWVRKFGTKFNGIEFGLPNDIDPHSFVSVKVHDCMEDISINQEDLWRNIKRGQEAQLDLHEVKNNLPFYYIKIKIFDDFIVVGEPSIMFGISLTKCLREIKKVKSYSKFPRKINNLWVKNIVTEIGDLGAEKVPRKFRTSGIWMGLRLEGLGDCIW